MGSGPARSRWEIARSARTWLVHPEQLLRERRLGPRHQVLVGPTRHLDERVIDVHAGEEQEEVVGSFRGQPGSTACPRGMRV